MNGPPVGVNAIGSDGGLCSTPRDLVRWIRAFAAGRVVSPASVELMTRTRIVAGEDRWYGYGMRVSPAAFGHTGSTPWFSAMMVHYPDEDLTLTLVANGNINLVSLMRGIAHQVRESRDAGGE